VLPSDGASIEGKKKSLRISSRLHEEMAIYSSSASSSSYEDENE